MPHTVKLRRDHGFVKGHVFRDLLARKEYAVISPGPHATVILDEKGKRVHISHIAMRVYFKETKE